MYRDVASAQWEHREPCTACLRSRSKSLFVCRPPRNVEREMSFLVFLGCLNHTQLGWAFCPAHWSTGPGTCIPPLMCVCISFIDVRVCLKMLFFASGFDSWRAFSACLVTSHLVGMWSEELQNHRSGRGIIWLFRFVMRELLYIVKAIARNQCTSPPTAIVSFWETLPFLQKWLFAPKR